MLFVPFLYCSRYDLFSYAVANGLRFATHSPLAWIQIDILQVFHVSLALCLIQCTRGGWCTKRESVMSLTFFCTARFSVSSYCVLRLTIHIIKKVRKQKRKETSKKHRVPLFFTVCTQLPSSSAFSNSSHNAIRIKSCGWVARKGILFLALVAESL